MAAYGIQKSLHFYIPHHMNVRLEELKHELIKNEQTIHLFSTDSILKPTTHNLCIKAIEHLILEFSPHAFGELPIHATDPYALNPWNSF